MCGLPTETDDDLRGIIQILQEATHHCRQIKKDNPSKYKYNLDITCTISNFVPKPFTPFQWYGQTDIEETHRKHEVLRHALKDSGLRNVTLNMTNPKISQLEAVISRGDRTIASLILKAFRNGAVFDAWDDKFKPQIWQDAASKLNLDLKAIASTQREVGLKQPWDIVHVGLNDWWLVKEWEKAIETLETAPCTENACHACGYNQLDTTHKLAAPKTEVMKRNPFVTALCIRQTTR